MANSIDLLNGFKYPDTEEIKQQVLDRYARALPNAILDDATPLGMLINADTALLQEFIEAYAFMLSQYNVKYAKGVFLDAMYKNLGIERISNSYSYATVTFYGTPNQRIPIGTVVANSDNDEFITQEEAIMTSSGAVNVLVKAVEEGAVPVGVGTITKLNSAVPNITSVNNITAGTIGSLRETDANFRVRARGITGLGSNGGIVAIRSAVNNVDGVVNSVVIENTTNAELQLAGVKLLPHSIYCCALGGTDYDIAYALFSTKSAGSQYTGDISVSIKDGVTSYSVKISRPVLTATYVKLTVDSEYSEQFRTTDVRNVVLNYYTTLGIGSELNPIDMIGYIYENLDGIKLKSLTVSKDGSSYGSAIIEANVNVLYTISSENIQVTYA